MMDSQNGSQQNIPASSTPQFGEVPFSAEEKEAVRNQLAAKLGKEDITYRSGPGGRKW